MNSYPIVEETAEKELIEPTDITVELLAETMPQVEEETIYYIGDRVKIKPPTEGMDSEDYYYLQSFQKKTGVVVKIEGDQTLYYHIDFDGNVGIFYNHDLIYIG